MRESKAKRVPPLRRRRWPKSDWESELARLGYWAGLVQKVVKKWSPLIGEDFCKDYILDCAFSVRAGSNAIDVKLKTEGHIGYVLELLAALHQMHNDAENLDRWLLELATSLSRTPRISVRYLRWYCDKSKGGLTVHWR